MSGQAKGGQGQNSLLLPGLALAFAVYYLYDVWGERAETMLYGLLIGVLVIVLSAVTLLSSLWRGQRHGLGLAFDPAVVLPIIRKNRRPIFLFSALVLYVIAQPWIGFTLATALFLGAALWVLGTRHWPVWLPLTMGLTLSAHLIFFHLLNVPLPAGPFS